MEGLYLPPHPPLAVMAPRAWLTLFGSLVGSGLQWAQLPHPLPTRSPSPTPKPSSFSPRQGQSSLLAWAQPNVCTQLLLCAGRGAISSPPSPHIPTLLPPAHPNTPAATTALAAHVGPLQPACPPSPAVGSVGSPLLPHSWSPPPAPHPAAVPTGPWGWLLAYGCWSSSPSTSTSPQPASSTSGEGSGAVGCCCHSPGHAQPPWVGGREGLGCGRDGEGVCAARSHTVSPSPAASWAPRSPSASGRTPRTSRWRMCPARLVSWAGVPLVLLLSSPCPVTGCPFPGTGKRGLPSHIPVPLAELGAGVEWAAVGAIPWLCLWGGVSWVVGKHPLDHLLSIHRASEGRAGGRAGPEDRANRSGRGRSKAWSSLGAGVAGDRVVGVLLPATSREARCAPALGHRGLHEQSIPVGLWGSWEAEGSGQCSGCCFGDRLGLSGMGWSRTAPSSVMLPGRLHSGGTWLFPKQKLHRV